MNSRINIDTAEQDMDLWREMNSKSHNFVKNEIVVKSEKLSSFSNSKLIICRNTRGLRTGGGSKSSSESDESHIKFIL